jgi:ATP-binding cassette subfamily F protein 3
MKATTDEEAIELATLLAHAHERLNAIGAADHDMQIERMLKGIGFVEKDMHRLMSELSGGWRMRAELARLLLMQPDLLLLDEPTNHLGSARDPMVGGSAPDLSGGPGADQPRQDLPGPPHQAHTGRWAVGSSIVRCLGAQYVELRKVEREQQASAAKEQQRYIKETTDLINKFRAKASKAAFAQSLITKLDKLDRIEVEDEDLRKMLVKFPPAPHSGKIVCRGEGA